LRWRRKSKLTAKTGWGFQAQHRPVVNGVKLGGFGNFSGFNATGTNFHSLGAALWQLHANGLQIRIKSPRCSIVCVRNIVSELRTFTADFATFGHDFIDTSRALMIAAGCQYE
jgi:hypothetical protein